MEPDSQRDRKQGAALEAARKHLTDAQRQLEEARNMEEEARKNMEKAEDVWAAAACKYVVSVVGRPPDWVPPRDEMVRAFDEYDYRLSVWVGARKQMVLESACAAGAAAVCEAAGLA